MFFSVWGKQQFALAQRRPPAAGLEDRMRIFLFQCPATGLKVQGFTAEAVENGDRETYEAVSCLACGQAHFVDPKTRKTVGADED